MGAPRNVIPKTGRSVMPISKSGGAKLRLGSREINCVAN